MVVNNPFLRYLLPPLLSSVSLLLLNFNDLNFLESRRHPLSHVPPFLLPQIDLRLCLTLVSMNVKGRKDLKECVLLLVFLHSFLLSVPVVCHINFCICIMSSSLSSLDNVLVVSQDGSDNWWDSFSRRMSASRWHAPLWDRRCSYCHALLLRGERDGFCCTNGRTITPRLPPLPPSILSLCNERNISPFSRRLNSLFCFTAIGASKGFQSFRTGVWNVAITGRTYHRIFHIRDTQHCLHWYLYDEQDRLSEASNRNVPMSWVTPFALALENVNPYVHHLRQFSSTWTNATDSISALELSDVSATGDFAAIMHANNSTDIRPRSIMVWHNSQSEPSFIPIFSRHYEPLQYPLLFPHGTLGWGLSSDANGELRKSLPFTQREWYKNQLLTDDRFLMFGRLTSEYLCDMYSRIEEEHLLFIRRGRLHQAHEIDPDLDDDSIDIKLPVSFLGSKEWSSSETADALALAREFGPPSLFITMTCNRDWPEIVSRLRPGQTAYDVPIIVARVFKERLHRLLDILNTKFGTLMYIIHVIEFQKRGFPHAHIIIKVSCSLLFPYLLSFTFSSFHRLILNSPSRKSTSSSKQNYPLIIQISDEKSRNL